MRRSSPQVLLCRPASVCPLGFGSSESAEEPSASTADIPSGTPHEIFRCRGIEGPAVQLRRCVQVGMTLEFLGTQSANLFFHDNLEVISTFSDFNTFLVSLHIYIVWRYASLMRDALLARHVTRVAVLLPQALPNSDCKLESGSSAISSEGASPPSAALQAAMSEVVAGQPLTIIVETGPWMRHLHLEANSATQQGERSAEGSGDEESRPSLGDLVRLGCLHVDRSRGEVLDADALQRLLACGHRIASETLHKDVALMRQTYVSEHLVSPSLDGVSSEHLQWLDSRPYLHSLVQFNGGKAMNLFSVFALTMGLGTIYLWLPIPGIGKSLGGFAMKQAP